jgi:hypothetical protein
MSTLPRRRAAAVALALALLTPVLAACASPVHLTPAAKANTAGCADVVVHLPPTLESLSQRETNAQGTAAWGSPAAVLLTCGITTPTVSDLPCYTIEGVDWLVEQVGQGGQDAIYTTYGRTPGVQVVVNSKTTGSNVLFDLASAVGSLHQTGKCQSVSDTTPTSAPTPKK